MTWVIVKYLHDVLIENIPLLSEKMSNHVFQKKNKR